MAPQKWAVDEIIEVPESLILQEYGYIPNRSAATAVKKSQRRRRTTKQKAVEEAGYEIEIPALEPYLGHEALLVRTALIRSKRFPKGRSLPYVNAPERAAHLCYHMTAYDQEHMVVLAINNQNRVTAIHETAIGGRSGAQASPLDLIKVPILTSSVGMIAVHNHPSGNPEPSAEDKRMEGKLEGICTCVGLTLLDFMIVALNGWSSVIFELENQSWDRWLIEVMEKQKSG